MARKDQVLNGRYRLLSLEGEGGMAKVYRARDLALDREVAVKILHPQYDAGNAFRREARAAAQLPHPNIVTVYDVGQDGDLRYIVMEYAQGVTLKDLLETHAPLRIGRTIDIMIQVCDAVGFAHEKAIIHCDVKPQNILVQPDGTAKVTDFGIARAFSTSSTEQRSRLWGTPYYACPEIISGRPLTPASDVYAIGVILYEALCGTRPFTGQTAADIARQHVADAPPPLEQHNPRVTRYLRQVVDRALDKDPGKRYASAKELAQALRRYRQHGTQDTQPLQPVRVPAPSPGQVTPPTGEQTASRAMLRTRAKRQVDWVMFLLGGLAFLSVMGLLPLWGTVIARALVPSTPAPTATVLPVGTGLPTPTQDLTQINTPTLLTPSPVPEVMVPDLVGRELEQARQLTHEAGLILIVQGQRNDPTLPESHITEQSPAAGASVRAGSEVSAWVSLGPELVVMPEATGFPAEIQRLNLEDLGLVVAITETWSLEPLGLVISQTPPAGTPITVGAMVTLTVSSGLQDEVQANFGDKVVLVRFELEQTSPRPGDTLSMLFTWQVLERLEEDYTLFVHVVDLNGRIRAQRDEPPAGGGRPTSTWQPGDELRGMHTIHLPGDMPTGDYWVQVGLYRGVQRLPVVDPGLAKQKDNAVVVRQITIQGN